MLKPKYIEQLPASLVELYSQAEMDILADMARRIATYDYFIPAAQWQYRKLIEMGNYHNHVAETLAALTGRTRQEIESLMEEAGQKALAFDDSIYRKAGMNPPPLSASPALQEVIETGIRNTGGLFENLTRTTANTATRQFEYALDRAHLQITSGGFDRGAATRNIIKELSQQGIRTTQYPTGHSDHIEVSVRRALITGVNQMCAKLTEERMTQMGCNLVEVTAHTGARNQGSGAANHAAWQGRVYRWNK